MVWELEKLYHKTVTRPVSSGSKAWARIDSWGLSLDVFAPYRNNAKEHTARAEL